MDEGLEPAAELVPVGGQEFAAQIGLRVKTTAAGRQVLVEDGTPEARRRRLWGQMWREHQMPLLPTTAELLQALAQAGAEAPILDAIAQASAAVDAALAAKIRADALCDQTEQGEQTRDVETFADIEALWKLGDQLPTLLAAYARALTAHLPALRLTGNPS